MDSVERKMSAIDNFFFTKGVIKALVYSWRTYWPSCRMLSLIDVDGMVGEELVTEAAQNGGRLGLVPFVWDLAYRRGARTFHYGLDSE